MDEQKTRGQLIQELAELRGRIAALEASEQQRGRLQEELDFILNRSPVLLCVAGLDGYYKQVNPAFERILGHSEEESLSRPFMEFIHPEDRPAAAAHMERLAAGETITDFEDRNLCKDGSYRWLEWTVVPLAEKGVVYGVGREITKRKRAEQELRRERNRAREYLNIAGVILVVLDQDGNVSLLNRKGHEILEYEEGQLVGKNWFDACLPQREKSRVRSVFDRLMAGEIEPVEYTENPVLTRSGEQRLIAWHNTILTDDGGQRVGTLSSGEDITARRQTEEELRKSHEELESRVQERTADLVRANTRLKREIRDRLQAQAELVKQQRVLEHMLASGDRERKLIAYEIHDGLAQQLAGARMQLETAGRLQQQEPEKAVDCCNAALGLLDEGLLEARRLISGLRPPVIDEMGIVSAIENLAADASAAGAVRVEFHHEVEARRLPHLLEDTLLRVTQESLANARRHSRSEKVRVELRQEEDSVCLEVRDWGVGFDPQKVREGCFGLEGIQQRAKLLGGEAEIHSAPGEGTRILVRLPLTAGETNSGE